MRLHRFMRALLRPPKRIVISDTLADHEERIADVERMIRGGANIPEPERIPMTP